MTVERLRPNGVFSKNAYITDDDGSTTDANLYGAVDDAPADNASWIEAAPAAPGSITYALTNPTIPSGARVAHVRPVLLCKTEDGVASSGGAQVTLYQGTDPFATEFLLTANWPTTATEVSFAAHEFDLWGDEWRSSTLNDLRIEIVLADGAHKPVITEVYVDVTYDEAPTVTVDAPADPVTDTTFPTITWTYDDPEDQPQAGWEVRVFTAAEYGAGDFLPWGLNNPLLPREARSPMSIGGRESGVQFGAGASWEPTEGLDNGVTYRAYVAVRDPTPAGFYDRWSYLDGSHLDYKQFTITLTAPAAPVVDGVATSAALGRVTGVIHGSELSALGGPPTTQTLELERSVDGGATWQDVRGYQASSIGDLPATVTFYDYEVPRGATVKYRARSTVTITGELVSSLWGESASILVGTDGPCAWLKPAGYPAQNISVDAIDLLLPSTSEADIAVFNPRGRSTPIAHWIGNRAERFEKVRLFFATDAAFEAFEAIRALGVPVLFQTPYGETEFEQRWVRLGTRTVSRVTYRDMHRSQYRYVDVAMIEVAEPVAA